MNLCPNEYISARRELFTNAAGLKIQALDNHAFPLTHDEDARREYAPSFHTLTAEETKNLESLSAQLREAEAA